MRVAASTVIGESALSEENDIFVRTPEDGKYIICNDDVIDILKKSAHISKDGKNAY